jgi:hypothetical protein
MLIHQRHADYQFGVDEALDSVEENVHRHFVECYALIEKFGATKATDKEIKVANRL